MLTLSETSSTVFAAFFIIGLGYALGRIRVCGVGLGAAGVFIVGLLFGHFGVSLPPILQNVGLVLFITAVGFSAGSGFLLRLKRNGLAYIALCLTTAFIGCCVCVCVIRLVGIDTPLAVGIMTGAFTTSPGFAAAKEAAGANAVRVAAGYGIAYPVGVLCKVMFIQLIPRILHADMAEERRKIAVSSAHSEADKVAAAFRIDKLGLCSFSIAVVIGVLLGAISIPLHGGSRFALGLTGGPLVIGLLFSGLGSIGPVDTRVDSSMIAPAKEIGCALFFAGAGTEGGQGLAEILSGYGALPLLLAFVFVSLPLLGGFVMFRFVLKLPLLNGLGAMTASMTCTPSLAVLTQLAGTDDVAAAYATTYPIALITLVMVVQMLILL